MERAHTQGQEPGQPAIDVAVCTFRRDSLEHTLASLAAQVLPQGVSLRVIVADNDDTPAAEERIRALGASLGLDLDYRHAPARNISIARNACLEAARAEWLGFLDDDEIASPQWAAAMLGEARAGGWDAVLGPVHAVYDGAAPGWMRQGDFHSTRPVVLKGSIETGYSGNVLLRRRMVEAAGLRFDLRFGRTGGEDLDFFYRLRDAGGRIGFAEEAWAREPVPSGRASLKWLLSRTFRAGQSHGSRLTALQPRAAGRARHAVLAGAKAAVCACGALATLPKAAARNRFLTRAALHLGVLARVAGLREIQLY